MQTLIASIIIFGLIIFVHEFGHYLLAKLSDVRVEEFSLGMGPKLIGKQGGETLYSLRAFPLGGFCKMSGEMGNEDYSPDLRKDSRRFDQKSVGKRAAIIMAGPIMNFFLAILLFILIFAVLGKPAGYTTRIGTVFPGSPAAEAGLKEGDRVTGIDGQSLRSWEEMVEIIRKKTGQSMEMEYSRDNRQYKISITPKPDASNVGKVGISPSEMLWQKVGLAGAIKEGLAKTYQITRLTLLSFVDLARGRMSAEDISGPVGIVSLINESARFGLVYLVDLTGLISVSLGIFNLLPIPALDGGRMVFIVFEAVLGRPVNPAKENFVHLVGFVLLLMLMMLVTYRDILRLIGVGG